MLGCETTYIYNLGDDPNIDAGSGSLPDGSVVDGSLPDGHLLDGGVDAGPPTCADYLPTENFGALVGDYIREFTLPRCDGASTPFDFYGETYCTDGRAGGELQAQVTFMALAAGWCGPCRAEAQAIRDALFDEFAARGVRFIQVVIEDTYFGPADMDYCVNGWLGDFGEVPQITLVDVPGVNVRQNILNPPQGLPFSVIVGPGGEVIAAKSGFSVQGLREDLEAALALYE